MALTSWQGQTDQSVPLFQRQCCNHNKTHQHWSSQFFSSVILYRSYLFYCLVPCVWKMKWPCFQIHGSFSSQYKSADLFIKLPMRIFENKKRIQLLFSLCLRFSILWRQDRVFRWKFFCYMFLLHYWTRWFSHFQFQNQQRNGYMNLISLEEFPCYFSLSSVLEERHRALPSSPNLCVELFVDVRVIIWNSIFLTVVCTFNFQWTALLGDRVF